MPSQAHKTPSKGRSRVRTVRIVFFLKRRKRKLEAEKVLGRKVMERKNDKGFDRVEREYLNILIGTRL